MTLSVQSYVDAAYRNRWRTLESVNSVLESLISQLQNQGQLNNTFIIVTSDNGFHTGQFRMPLHKKLPYEFDIRVPMAMIGPGVSQGERL
jgi:N-acetylglucosamine-6-sulfatase